MKMKTACLIMLFTYVSILAVYPIDEKSQTEPPVDKFINLPVPLFINDQHVGEISSFVSDDAILVKTSDFIEAIEDIADDLYLENITESNVQMLTINGLQNMGLDILFDSNELTMSLYIPVESLRPMNIGSSKQVLSVTDTSVDSQPVSGFLNIYTNTNMDVQSAYPEEYFVNGNYSFEGSINFRDFIFDGTYRTDDSFNFNPLSLTATRDLYNKRLRIQAGHYNAPRSKYMTSGLLQGVFLSFKPSMDPMYRNYSNSDIEFVIQKPGKAEVWVNGRKTRQFQLSPGRYRLSDLPLYSGLNEVEVKIYSGDQVIAEHVMTIPGDSRLITKGSHDFSYAVGTHPWNPNDVILNGFHRYGFNDYITTGASLEVAIDHLLTDVSVLWAAPAGSILADAAFSLFNWSEYGWAGSLGYRFSQNKNVWVPSFGITGEMKNSSFYTGGDPEEAITVSAYVSQKLARKAVFNTGINYKYSDRNDSDVLVHGSLSIMLNNFTGLYASGRVSVTDPSLETASATLMLQFRDNTNHLSMNHTQDMITAKPRFDMQWNDDDTPLAVSASVEGASQRQDFDYGVKGKGLYSGEKIGAALSVFSEGYDGDTITGISADISTGIVFAGRHAALSSPVSDSFIIVVPRYDMEGKRIGVNFNGLDYESKSTILGPPVISSIPSYRQKQIELDVIDFESDGSLFLRDNSFIVFPTYHSGTVIYAGSPPVYDVFAQIASSSGEPKSLITGSLFSRQGDKEEMLFFTDEEGLAVFYGLEPGEFVLKISGHEPAVFQVKETPENTNVKAVIIVNKIEGDE